MMPLFNNWNSGMTWSKNLVWMCAVNHGIAFGAGLYEHKVVVPLWIENAADEKCKINSEEMRRTDSGKKFWIFVGTIPLTSLTLCGLYVSYLSKSESKVARWLQLSSVLSLVERSFTFSFFIPNAIRLMNADRENKDRSDLCFIARLWVRLNYVRLLLSGTAWISALSALSLIESE
jgi:hypothetical protein